MMKKNRSSEIEIKFDLGPADVEAVKQAFLMLADADWRTRSLRTVYFDTPTHALNAAGVTLRVRESAGDAHLMCFKSRRGGNSPFQRREIEVPVPGPAIQLSAFDAKLANEIGELLQGEKLEAAVTTQITRTEAMLNHRNSTIEIAADTGEIMGGGRIIDIKELELELQSGSEADLIDLALGLTGQLPLKLDFISKREKGYLTSGLAPCPAVKALPTKLTVKANVESAMTEALRSCLAQITGNWGMRVRPDDPDVLHQLRVGLRRLGVALSLFEDAFPSLKLHELRSRFKVMARATGSARDHDVLLAAIKAQRAEDAVQGRNDMIIHLEAQRDQAYGRLRSVVDSVDATVTVLFLHQIIAGGTWIDSAAKEMKVRRQSAQNFARKALQKQQRKALKLGSGFGSLEDADRHQLRIALKKLRYASEFFSGLFGHGKLRKVYLDKLRDLQNLLGQRNDAAAARSVLESAALAEISTMHFAGSWLSRRAPVSDKELREVWRRFKSADVFWE